MSRASDQAGDPLRAVRRAMMSRSASASSPMRLRGVRLLRGWEYNALTKDDISRAISIRQANSCFAN